MIDFANISFKDNIPINNDYNDIYFSKENGEDESLYVYIKGNKLPKYFSSNQHATIVELGFGTGLNLSVLIKFLEQFNHKKLIFKSFEKSPLTPYQIAQAHNPFALTPWLNKWLVPYADLYINNRLRTGKNLITINNNIICELFIGDALSNIAKENFTATHFFLDGFAPSCNPSLWSNEIINEMSKKSSFGTRFSTFSCAGFLRKNLIAHGFKVEKIKGFANKKHMLIGQYAPKDSSIKGKLD